MPSTAYSASQNRKRISSIIVSILSIIAVLLVDQFSKQQVSLKLSVGQSIPIIKNVLHITFVRNTGAAFGLFKNSAVFFILVSIAAILVILTILARSIKQEGFSGKDLFNFGLILIMSGAFGNLIDRLKFGYVIDFIDIRIWPVFNIADSSVTVGTLILVAYFMRSKPSALTKCKKL